MSRKEDAIGAILEAAEAIVAKAGAAHLTLEGVAEQSGLSKGGVLYHFPSKEALLQGMVAHLLEQTTNDRQKFRKELGTASAADLVAHIQTGFLAQPGVRPIATSLMAAAANNPKLLEPVRQWQAQNFHGMVKTKRKPIKAAVVMMAIDGYWFNELFQTTPLNGRERKELMKELIRLARAAS